MPDAAPPPPVTVEEVVVTAARLPPRPADAAFSVTLISPGELAEAPRLDEALTDVPGVSLFRRTTSLAANPTTQGISLRAIAPSGAGRTLVLLDGAPVNDPFGGWVIWSQVPPESLTGVQVVRGAGAGPYGAGALTGVIDLYERGRGGLNSLTLAQDGGLRAAGADVVRSGDARLFGMAAYERSDGYTPVRGPRAGAADTPLDLETRSAALRLDLPLSAMNLSLRIGGFDEERGAGLAGARAEASGWSASAALARQPADGALGWRLQAWVRGSDFSHTSVAVAPDRSATTPANDQYATPATGWGVNAALRHSGATLDWELGADARVAEGEDRERFRFMAGAFTRDRRAGGTAAVAGLYAEGAWRPRGDWLVTGGVRIDHWKTSDGLRLEHDLATGAVLLDEHPVDRDGEVPTARLGVRREFNGGLAWRAAAYSSFRPPTLNELHRPFRVGNDITEANAALEPERLYGLETGLQGGGDNWRFATTLFWNRIDDPVANVTIGVGPGVFPRAGFVPAGGVLRERQNAGRIDAIGLEASLERELGENLSLRLAADFTAARVDGGSHAPQLTGLRPAQAPEWTVVGGADWRPLGDRLTLAADLRWEGPRFEDDLNSRVLGQSLSVDLRADWAVTERLVAWVGADNLFDANVEVSETADGTEGFGPPRTLRAGLRVSY
jgi:outer membrane receptor protein involved in Fe transport